MVPPVCRPTKPFTERVLPAGTVVFMAVSSEEPGAAVTAWAAGSLSRRLGTTTTPPITSAAAMPEAVSIRQRPLKLSPLSAVTERGGRKVILDMTNAFSNSGVVAAVEQTER